MLRQAGYFRIRFAADPVELTLFRAGLNRWLIGIGWPDVDRQDAVLAVNEACEGGLRAVHYGAGRPEVEVTARVTVGVDSRRIVAVVRDEAPFTTDGQHRDLGLMMLHACMDRVRIRRTEDATVVTMTSRPVPLLETVVEGESDAAWR